MHNYVFLTVAILMHKKFGTGRFSVYRTLFDFAAFRGIFVVLVIPSLSYLLFLQFFLILATETKVPYG